MRRPTVDEVGQLRTIAIATAVAALSIGCGPLSIDSGPSEVGDAPSSNGGLDSARELIREHWATLQSMDGDPLAGTSWGPGFDDYAADLRQAVKDGGFGSLPDLPWTSEQLARVDELARDVGLIDGPPLLP
ncbi:MAG: hypothetical protein AAGF73_11950 [Actinomycetota bacterium]